MPARQIIYLACPYTHPSYSVREQRFNAATKVAAALIRQGHVVFSPITMTHPIDSILAGEEATLGSNYWVEFDEAFMDACSAMVILKIDGWNLSDGIRREIEYFRMQRKPIRFVSMDAELLTADLAIEQFCPG
jgi:hypothetical protein